MNASKLPLSSGRPNEDAITEEVLARYAGTADPRIREIMLSLIKHLHGFVKDVRLTWEEWYAATQFLEMSGHVSQGGRHEFHGLSALLGVEVLVLEVASPKPPGATLPTVSGPFYVPNSPKFKNGEDISNGARGEPLYVSGRVLDTRGNPIANAIVEAWHSDDRGLYDVQETHGFWARGQLTTDTQGRYSFWSIAPVAYPAPRDGGMGGIFNNTSNHEWRPAHVHFQVGADGYDAIMTEIFMRGSKYLDSDTAFGVRPGLIADYPHHASGTTAPDGTVMQTPYRTLAYDFVLTRGGH